uniref:Uncharacterized protein n=1 Tax=Ciona savignyi TaxID=51511 RepID=H2ZJG3_CIOSA
MPHASYYGNIDAKNPVICASEKEIKEVLSFFLKNKSNSNTKSGKEEACSRGTNWLFDIWNKYEPRLPLPLFFFKLVSVGDTLRDHGIHDVANRQCYQRYLITKYGETCLSKIENLEVFKSLYFDPKQDSEELVLTSKAVLGMLICEFESELQLDTNLQSVQSLKKCQLILRCLRTFTQCLLAREELCWVLFNCTIVIYRICRSLMSSGNSLKSIEFLVWGAMCMESSLPLLGIKYLSWRVTMYSAVCLAYYDCKASQHAEAFARRALRKLQELSELQHLSDEPESAEAQCIFREATAKMASMVFKRSVYET